MNAVADWNEIPAVPALHPVPTQHEAVGPGDLIAGRYRLDAVIGHGGMATVYRGHDERLSRDVAIKVCQLDPECPHPPLQEERVASALIHDHIVSIFDAGEISEGQPGAGSTFIVMEYVHGSTACDVAPLAWDRAANVVLQASEGLAAAHERGIVHCDVKPSNLLIDSNGRVLVADFGVAATAESESGEYVHGSPSYIAPERLAGEPADPRMDVFGLGGVLAYLLTGVNPPVDSVPQLPSSLPAAVRDVVLRARAQQPSVRYADARAFHAALSTAVDIPSRSGSGGEDIVWRQEPTRHVRVERRGTPLVSAVPSEPRVVARRVTRLPNANQPAPVNTRGRSLGRAGTVLMAIVVALLIVFAGSVIVRDTSPVGSGVAPVAAAVDMPDVRGGTFGEAIDRLAERGLVVSRVEVIYGPGPLNQIVAQEPAPGTEVNGDTEIALVVRTGR